VRSGINLGRVELIVKRLGSKKTLPQLMSEQQLHNTIENLSNKPHKKKPLKGGI